METSLTLMQPKTCSRLKGFLKISFFKSHMWKNILCLKSHVPFLHFVDIELFHNKRSSAHTLNI